MLAPATLPAVFPYPEPFAAFRRRARRWALAYEHVTALENNGLPYPAEPFPNLLAVGCRRALSYGENFFTTLADRHGGDWLFGYLGYDLKNQLERLRSDNDDFLRWPAAAFCVPEAVVRFEADGVHVLADDPAAVFAAIRRTALPAPAAPPRVSLRQEVSRAEYLQRAGQLREHIAEGDIYEVNYCVPFRAEDVLLEPLDTFEALNARSPMPFAAFQRFGDRYLLCASPERFLRKQGDTLLSQPIKGTAPRGSTLAEDAARREALRHSEKERAENLMIVDLVRNDLARSAAVGTVEVPELFGVYTFRAVHQMISTVRARLGPGHSWADALRHAFPMGSMTGAPKIRAMELIERYECFRRGIYSGAVGYVTPAGDFDFNVVIRSIVYDATTRRVELAVGSALTYDADPAQEYEECLLKAEAMRAVLGAR